MLGLRLGVAFSADVVVQLEIFTPARPRYSHASIIYNNTLLLAGGYVYYLLSDILPDALFFFDLA